MPKKHINLLLITGAAIIWSVIFFRIILPSGEESVSTPQTINDQTNALHKQPYEAGVVRDPFENPWNRARPQPVQKTVSQPKPTSQPPPVSISGLLQDEQGVLVLLLFRGSETLLMRPGEEQNGIRLLKVAWFGLISIALPQIIK